MTASVREVLQHVRHWLPPQGAIKDFIHHNTLHGFQKEKFDQAVFMGELLYGARGYLTLSEFRSRFQNRQILEEHIDRALASKSIAFQKWPEWKTLMNSAEFQRDYPEIKVRASRTLRESWGNIFDVRLRQETLPLFQRLLSAYLDQGISYWRFNGSEPGFLAWVKALRKNSLIAYPVRNREPTRLLRDVDPATILESVFEKVVGGHALVEAYLIETMWDSPGWMGLISEIERKPSSLLSTRAVTLEEVVGVKLLLELDLLWDLHPKGVVPLWQQLSAEERKRWEQNPHFPFGQSVKDTSHEDQVLRQILDIWLRADEWAAREPVFRSMAHQTLLKPESAKGPKFQGIFCLDDRECSLRRHLEEVEPEFDTYAVAGFFGVDSFFMRAGEVYPTQQCPAPVTPRHLIREVSDQIGRPSDLSMLKRLGGRVSRASEILPNWVVSQALGIGSALKLMVGILNPATHSRLSGSLLVSRATKLHIERIGNESNDGLLLGYSISEMADRVEGCLRSMGRIEDFAPLVCVVAHGASSVNNPHFAAYDCGACSGRPGALNARVFSMMANDSRVRAALDVRGISVPESTKFVGGFHDTTADRVEFFDTTTLSSSHKTQLELAQVAFERALNRNALERCRKFDLDIEGLSEKSARKEVFDRSKAIFEPRPELNHANNAFVIIGRRALSRGLFLDRRAFLTSYDCRQDPRGKILGGILAAVVPVCGGINLEYYFSRVDNKIYGAGTKLPHNVVGLFGVTNGVRGDLQTGLPVQMIELHEPIRLEILVECDPQILQALFEKMPVLGEWTGGEWLELSSCDPESGKIYSHHPRGYIEIEIDHSRELPHAHTSLELIAKPITDIAVHLLERGTGS